MKNLAIVLTFFGLWLSTQLSSAVQDFVAYGLILTFGVLHGANDITIISSITNEKGALRRLMLPYLGAVLLVSLLFLISKGIALAFFILISAYHFGEQHFSNHQRKQSGLAFVLYFFYGLVILFMIFYIRLNEVIIVIEDVSGWILKREFVLRIFIVASATTIVLAYKLLNEGFLQISPIKELFYLMVLSVAFANASLIWGFAIYFIFWHSLPSIKNQLVFLYGKANKSSFKMYLRTSSLYWVISILGLVILYMFLREKVDYFISVVLYVLAAITFPHVLVMSRVEMVKK